MSAEWVGLVALVVGFIAGRAYGAHRAWRQATERLKPLQAKVAALHASQLRAEANCNRNAPGRR